MRRAMALSGPIPVGPVETAKPKRVKRKARITGYRPAPPSAADHFVVTTHLPIGVASQSLSVGNAVANAWEEAGGLPAKSPAVCDHFWPWRNDARGICGRCGWGRFTHSAAAMHPWSDAIAKYGQSAFVQASEAERGEEAQP